MGCFDLGVEDEDLKKKRSASQRGNWARIFCKILMDIWRIGFGVLEKALGEENPYRA